MPFNLIDTAKSMIPQDLVSKAAGSLGENEGGIQKALAGAIPSVLAGLLAKNSGAGAAGILDMVKQAAGGGFLNNLSSLTGVTSGGGIASTVLGWLRSLFGDRLDNVTAAIAGFAGIKSSSASSALSMAAPAALGSLGKYAQENNLTAAGLSSFLQSQKSAIIGSIPPGLNLAGALGLSGLGDIGEKITGSLSSAGSYTSDAAKKKNPWLWLLILLVAVLLIWLFTSKGCNRNEQKATIPVVPVDTPVAAAPAVTSPVYKVIGKIDTASGDFIYDQGQIITISLPNGGELKVGKWSTESRLVEFLTGSNEKIDTVKGNWFDFTDVRFNTGGSVITSSSMIQLKNLATIIRAFPDARFKIGGYTDNTGDAARNLALSQKRAEAVAAELVKQGASKKQLTGAEGYGSQFPAGDNSTAEGRAMNRRVSVNVKAR